MRRKILIRAVVVLAAIWIILLGLIYISGEKYRDTAISILKTHIDTHLNTEILIRRDDIHVNLLKRFPNVVIELKNILIKSSANTKLSDFNFSGRDTLLFAENISLIFNVKSFFTKNYLLRKIEIHRARLNILGDRAGNFNYQVFKKSQSNESQDTLKIDINDIEIRDMILYYCDINSGVTTSGNIQKAKLSGSYSESDLFITCFIEAEKFNLWSKSTRIMADEKLNLTTEVQKKGSVYSFTQGNITLSGIQLNAGGIYNYSDKSYEFTAKCRSASFQKLNNSWLNHYIKGISLKPAGGKISIGIFISEKGTSNPFVNLDFYINQGVLRQHEKKVKIEDLYVKGSYTNGQHRNSSTTQLNIDSLHFRSGESELFISGSISNFNSPAIQAKIRGNLELEKLNILPSVDSHIELEGNLNTDITVFGVLPRFNNITSKDIRKITLQGNILLEQALFKPRDKAIPSAMITGTINLKNLSEIGLNQVQITTGNTDLLISGNVTNLPLFTSDRSQFPVYRCNVKSNEFHVEDFLLRSGDEGMDTTRFIFPDSMIVYADIQLNSFGFGKFQANKVTGNLFYYPKTIEIEDFSMQSQGGTIKSHISIAQTGESILTTADANLTHVDISELFYAFNEFGQSVITHQYIGGAFSGHAEASALWDLMMNPIYNKLYIQSDFTIENGELINYQPLMGLSDYIAVEELKHIKFDDLHASVLVKDEKVTLDQTTINSSAISIKASGEHDFENRYTYKFQVHLADVLWKKAKKRKPQNTEFGYVVNDDRERTILPLVITGKDTVFNVSYDKKTAAALFRNKLKKEKQEWEELVTPDSSSQKENNPLPVEWEEDVKNDKKENHKTKDDKQNEFQIEWDDD